MQERPSFEDLLNFGKEGENIIGRLLLERGCTIMPLYQYENHNSAPIALVPNDAGIKRIPLPDLTCFAPNLAAFFAEVKRKQRWVSYMKDTIGLETGFNQRQFIGYEEIESKTGLPVWLFFLQEKDEPTGVFAQQLKVLAQHARFWDGRSQRTGAYITQPELLFPKSCLIKICDLADINSEAA